MKRFGLRTMYSQHRKRPFKQTKKKLSRFNLIAYAAVPCQHSEGHSEQGGKPRHMPSGGTSAGRTEGTSHGTEARGSVAWRWPQWAPSTGSGCPRDKCPPTATDTRSFKRLKPAPKSACHDGRLCVPSPTERGGHWVLLTTLFFPCMHTQAY